jgi:membrane protease YdiL (CAAX protease family)
MQPLRALLVYLVWVFVGGALLAPWLYYAAGWAVPTLGWGSLAEVPFHRYVSRSLLVLALLGLWPLLHNLGLRTRRELGLKNLKGEWGRLVGGFAVGFGGWACVAMLAIMLGARSLNLEQSPASFSRHVVNAGLAAVVVAFLEELLFRGALFGGLRKVHSWPVALAVSSAVYALVHFFARPASPTAVTWFSGLAQLGEMVHGLFELNRLVPSLLNLMLAGAILGLAYQRTGNLYFSIGLHAGWIFWLKSYGFLTRELTPGNPWFWGSGKLIDGWAILAVLGATLWFLVRHHFEREEPAS